MRRQALNSKTLNVALAATLGLTALSGLAHVTPAYADGSKIHQGWVKDSHGKWGL